MKRKPEKESNDQNEVKTRNKNQIKLKRSLVKQALLLSMALVKLAKGQTYPVSCNAESITEKKFFTVTKTGTAADELKVDCFDYGVRSRTHAWVKLSTLPTVSSKKQIIYTLGDIRVYFEYNGGDGKVYVRADASGIVALQEVDIGSAGIWYLIWFEVGKNFGADLTVIYYDTQLRVKTDFHDQSNFNFQLPVNSQQVMKLVSVTDPGTEEGFHGLIQNFGYSCAFFGVESNVALAWIPASYSHQGSLAASYLIDREAQVYGNIMDLESREPSLINGAGVGVDAQDLTRLPVDGQTRSIAKDDRYMKVENIDMGYSVDDMMFGISVLINVRFTGFPKVSQGYVTFLVLESDKRFEFQIDKSGWIRVKIDDAADIYMDSGYDAYYDFEIAMKLYVGKIKHMNKGIAEIYYTADSYGSYGFAQHGQFFDWDKAEDSHEARPENTWTVMLGNPNNAVSQMKMLVNMLSIFNSNVWVKESDGDQNEVICGNPADDMACIIQITETNANVCLNCTRSASSEWYIDADSSQIICEATPSGSTPSSANVYPSSEISYGAAIKRTCEFGEMDDGAGNCVACHPSCGGSCSGVLATECMSCSWEDMATLDGPAPNSCSVTCTAENFNPSSGVCTTCTTTGGCGTCSGGVCSSCSAGELVMGICCDYVSGPYYVSESNGEPACLGCHSSCATCEGAGEYGCLTCVGGAPKDANNLCPPITPTCASNEYLDSSTCVTCPTGCTTCNSASDCTACSASYALDSNPGTCVICTASNKYINTGNSPATCETCNLAGNFINNSNNPITCDSCPTDCATCTSSTSCQTCLNSKGIHNNLCKDCPSQGAFYLGSPNCVACPTDCTSCTSGSSCQSCSALKGLHNNLCVDCPSQGAFYLNGNICSSCPTDCQTCTSNSVCQSCSAGKGLHNNLCVDCPSQGAFFLNGNVCSSCPTDCATCTSNSACQTCSNGKGVHNGLCLDCPSQGAFYLNNNICTSCPTHCETCTNGSTCQSCSAGKGLHNNLCVDCPSQGAFYLSGGSCVQCPTGCETCTNGSTCQTCSAGKGLHNDLCVDCPSQGALYLNGNVCSSCSLGCSSCTSSSSCQSCEAGKGLQGGQCHICPSLGAYFLNGANCDSCPTDCSTCTSSSSCQSCSNGKGLLNGLCKDCPSEGSYFLNTGGNCQSCQSGCSSCSDASSCLQCDSDKYLDDNGNCVSCDPTNGFRRDDASTPKRCYDCPTNCSECDASDCLKCQSGTGYSSSLGHCVQCGSDEYPDEENPLGICLTCPEGSLIVNPEDNLGVEGPCISQEEYNELTAEQPPPIQPENQCHDSCSSCYLINDPQSCSSCPNNLCLKFKGECFSCPTTNEFTKNENPTLQSATLVWVLTQREANNYRQYRIDFSESDIYFDSQMDTKKIEDVLYVKIDNEEPNGRSYKIAVEFDHKKSIITIDFEFKRTMPRGKIHAEFNDRTKIKSRSGKTLYNSRSSIVFQGYSIASKSAKATLSSISKGSQTTVAVTKAVSFGALSLSRLFSNALACLSKLLQIIEFMGLMQFFNLDYEEAMGGFLRAVNEGTEFDLLKSPTNKMIKGVEHSTAGQWKGKLSQLETHPLVLQDLGYPGIILLVKIFKRNFK